MQEPRYRFVKAMQVPDYEKYGEFREYDATMQSYTLRGFVKKIGSTFSGPRYEYWGEIDSSGRVWLESRLQVLHESEEPDRRFQISYHAADYRRKEEEIRLGCFAKTFLYILASPILILGWLFLKDCKVENEDV